MRVTNNMIANNTVFNMQKSISRLLDLQVQLSTGRQINKPSDDPIGVQRDLNYRNELAKNAQYQNNNQQALTWMQNYDSSLSDLKDLYSSANEIAIAMANGTYDDITREGSAEEIASILEQMVQLANNEQEGRFIYSGYRTDQKPLILSSNGVVYKGDQGQIDYQIEAKSRMTVNLSGSDVFLKPLSVLGEKSDLNVAVTNDTLLADLHGGDGIDLTTGTFTIINENLGINATIDISGATTVGDLFDPATGINAQLAAAGITNVEIKLGEEGNNLLVDTTKSGLISNVTSIDKLNDGNGIDMENGKFVVSDGASISVEIDLSGAANVGEIITAFNSQMTSAGYPAVTMSLNAAGTGLQIDDAGGTPGLRIEDSSALSTTAIDLGIVGLIGTGLTGKDLDPVESFKIDDTTGTTAADLGINGSVSVDYSGNDLDPILLASSNLADLNNGMGFDL
ncbi:MAG: flagellar hook-associated protein FlgL, partial [bacterium]